MTGPIILVAEPADAGEILTLQRAAYVAEAQLYGDPSLPPLTETLDELMADVSAGRVLKAVVGHRIVGTGRAHQDGPVLRIGRLAVAPDLQGRGIGSDNRHGYAETHRGPGRTGVELIHLEKPALAAG